MVEAGQKIRVEKLDLEPGKTITFESVLLVSDGKKVEIGAPFVKDRTVEVKVLQQGRDKKKIVFRYKAKVRRRKKKGHRQPFTELEVLKIK